MCKHIGFVKALLLVVSSRSGVHHSPLHKNDLQVVVEELNQVKAFAVIPNCRHRSFKNPRNIIYYMLIQLMKLSIGHLNTLNKIL